MLHGDQVTKIPPSASVVATSSYCPVVALAYDFPDASIQFHPEYTRNFVTDVIDLIQEDVLGPQDGTKAKESMAVDDIPADLHTGSAAALFRKHLA